MKESVLVSGYRLDRYELLCPIAAGGMASVWLARLRGKRGFEKLFAVKTIRNELHADPRYQEMFLDEARIASGIEHPNVAQILDLGEQDGHLYIVLEWVDGESLARLAKLSTKQGGPLPLELTLRIVDDACAGLHAAHELRDVDGVNLGVVHRDVSPHNVLITTAGATKLIDFGVAKARHRSAGETQAGLVKGKIRYMAPEQAGGLEVDRRADIWALGMCLYELLLGRPPFDELSDMDVIRRLIGDAPAPDFAGEQMPGPVRSILDRSLTKDPEARFPTAAAMRRAIEVAMVELKMAPTTDDVAQFVEEHFPDLGKERRAYVADALTKSKGRSDSVPPPTVVEAALAETAMSDTGSMGAVPLVRKKAKSEAETKIEPRFESSPDVKTNTSVTSLKEQLGARPKGRGGWLLLATLVACAIGLLYWQRSALLEYGTTAEPSASESAPPPETSVPAIVEAAAPPPEPVVDAGAKTKLPAWPVLTATGHPSATAASTNDAGSPPSTKDGGVTEPKPTETVAPPPTQTPPPTVAPPPEDPPPP